MNVVMVSSEVAPFSKTGGLGAVVGELSAALVRHGHVVMTVSPRYGVTDLSDGQTVTDEAVVDIPAGGVLQRCVLQRVTSGDGVVHVLVQHAMFDRAGIYGDASGAYADNPLRFAVLCRAACEAARRVKIGKKPLGDDVVFHAHDWQGALLPLYLEAVYRPLGLFTKAPVVLTVHNVAHQGGAPAARFRDLELPPRWGEAYGLEWYGNLNLLKGGLLHADQLTTVSPTFADEMSTALGGFGLDAILRHRRGDLTGILNGVDTDTWDPATDPFLEAHFDADDVTGKAMCKAALQVELGLPLDDEVPLIGSVGRLDPQKGVELIAESIPWMVEQHGAQIVVLGSAQAAHRGYEDWLRTLERQYPRNVRAWIGFSEAVAHRIEAGCDLFVMPSRFEPCGLNQLYSLRYGTVPVVRAVGGLADSVSPAAADGSAGVGYRFTRFDGYALREALFEAIACWKSRPAAFAAIRRRGMLQDVSWNAAVPRYQAVYERARANR